MEYCTKNKKCSAYTLVEMSIVLVIVAVILGMTLYGSKMIENARVVKAIKDIESFRAATSSFFDMYKYLPGDLPKAHEKIPGCPAVASSYCNTLLIGNYAGDQVVGYVNWEIVRYQSYPLGGNQPKDKYDAGSDSTYLGQYAETVLFWYELEQAGFIDGVVTDFGVKGVNSNGEFGESLPASPISGGYWIGSLTGVGPVNAIWGRPDEVGSFPPLGVVIVAVSKLQPYDFYYGTVNGSKIYNSEGIQALKPSFAARMDRKLDDGLPSSGLVHAFGETSSCYAGDVPYIYKEAVDSYDCGLIISLYE